jgi:hypothetical protein
MTALPTILGVGIPQDHTRREQHHHQRPLLCCLPSTPLSSAINLAIIVAHIIAHIIIHVVARRHQPSTPTVVAQVIALCHCHRSPPPPSSMSSKDDAAYLLPLPLPPHQADKVKEIMEKVISMQSADEYAGQNSIFMIFCYKSAELRDVLLAQLLIDGLSMHAKENMRRKNMQKNAA